MHIRFSAYLYYPDGWEHWTGNVETGVDWLPQSDVVDRLFQEELSRTADWGYTLVGQARAFVGGSDAGWAWDVWGVHG